MNISQADHLHIKMVVLVAPSHWYHFLSFQLPNIKKVFLNCMTLRTAGAIYSKIVSELGLQQKGTERENIKAIEKALTSGKNPV